VKSSFERINRRMKEMVNVYGDGEHFYVEENGNKELIRLFNNDKLCVFAADDWQKMKCLPSLIFLSAADKMLAKDSPLTL